MLMPDGLMQDVPALGQNAASAGEPKTEMIRVFIMGKEHQVPAGLTIMKAMEYAGYRLVRGAGCRAGFCGACGTIYRLREDYRLYTALACQATAQEGMCLAQLPFVPANRRAFSLEDTKADRNVAVSLYPEIARCLSCSTCTKACPQGIEVMDYIQAALRGDYAKASGLSFDCIQCGLCAARCPAEIHHFHVAQLSRRLTARHLVQASGFLKERVDEIGKGKYAEEIAAMKRMGREQLKSMYAAQQATKTGGE